MEAPSCLTHLAVMSAGPNDEVKGCYTGPVSPLTEVNEVNEVHRAY